MNAETNQNPQAVTRTLQQLYSSYGYIRYKMNRFEEYDLYARNKDFLVSDSVITFTDTSGKLMALKPDVTLSIVKNTRDEPGTIRKLYYEESVYRISERSHSYQELPQVGLEAVGDIDGYTIYEVLKLAAGSLAATGLDCVLEISHLGLLDAAIRHAGIGTADQDRVLACIGSKNRHELAALCRELGVDPGAADILQRLAGVFGSPRQALAQVEDLLAEIADPKELAEFSGILKALDESKFGGLIRVDFSVTGSLRYYNGFVFKGYARGIPQAMLSGGQYDRMMHRMGRSSGAIGFAVYLDILEEYRGEQREYDVDTLLVYSPGTPIEAVEKRAKALTAGGGSILVQPRIPTGLRYRRLADMESEGE